MRIDNAGPLIVATDYWTTEYARAGYFYLSLNAGAVRLLVPPAEERTLPDFESALGVALSRTTSLAIRPVCSLLFDDETESPYALQLSPEQLDRLPPVAELPRAVRMLVYVRGADGGPRLAIERPGRVRVATRIPDLRPWQEG